MRSLIRMMFPLRSFTMILSFFDGEADMRYGSFNTGAFQFNLRRIGFKVSHETCYGDPTRASAFYLSVG